MACPTKMIKANLLLEAKKLQKLREEKNQKLVQKDTIFKTQVELQESRLQQHKLQDQQETIGRLEKDVELFRKKK